MPSLRTWSYGLIPLAVLVASLAKADESIRSITEDFVLAVLSANELGSAMADDDLRDLAEERARRLAEKARSQTGTVLGVTIPDSIVSLIDTSLLDYIEEHSEIEGRLTAVLVENHDASRTYQIALKATDTSETIFLHFDSPPPNLPVGHQVRVRGMLLPRLDDGTGGSARHMVLPSDGDALEVVSDVDAITAPAPVGLQRTGAFLVNFSDDPAFAEYLTYEKEWRQLGDLVRRHSKGRAWLSVGRVAQVELAVGHTCDTALIRQYLEQALSGSGQDMVEYDRVFAILPTLECGWRTQTAFPASPSVVFVGGEPNTKLLLRALLHSLGAPSDEAASCNFDTIHSECQSPSDLDQEYLREVNAVGISAFHKENLGWARADEPDGILTVEGSGSYRIFATDYVATRERRLALKLRRPAPLLGRDTTYYVEYRVRKVGGERLEPEVVVYIVSDRRVIDVVNLTNPDPVSVELQDDISVSDGRFVDHAADLEIDIVNAYPWAVDFDISFDPTSCVLAAPDIEFALSETPYLSAETTTRFSLAVSSRDSEHCGLTRPSLHLQAPNGWSVQQDPQMPTLKPGETVHMEVSVTIPPSEGPGFRDLEWIVQRDAPIEARRSTMLFVMPSTDGTTDESTPWENPFGLPHGGVMYGNPLGGEGPGNSTKVGHMTSIRFRAEKTGKLTKLHWHNRTLDNATITNRCGSHGNDGSVWCSCKNAGLDRYTCGYIAGNMYSVGNGGLTELTIQTDDGTSKHAPSGTIIGKIAVPSSQQGGFGNPNAFVPVLVPQYPMFNFDREVSVEAGKIYHIVMHNLRPPVKCPRGSGYSTAEAKNCDRDRGSQGLNGMAFYNGVHPKLHTGPYFGLMVLRKNSASNAWAPFLQNNAVAPWYVVHYTDGDAFGNVTYSYLSRASVREIGGAKKVRQRFTVEHADRQVNGFWLRVARKGGTGIGNLTGTLAGGGINVSASVGASSVSQSANVDQEVPIEWVYFTLPQNVVLKKGTQYTLTFSAPSGADYWLTAHISPNMPSKNAWNNAVAEYTTGGAWSTMRTDSYKSEADLALAFTIVGQPKSFSY